jgi:DNA-binding XRE family transcriptional regulator
VTKNEVEASSSGIVYQLETAVIHPPQPPGWRDIHERLAELERHPRRAAALARARQRLASTLHPAPSLGHLRMQQGLSQSELARRIGTSQSRLSRIEAGLDDPRYSTLTKIAAALGVDLNTLAQALAASQTVEQ